MLGCYRNVLGGLIFLDQALSPRSSEGGNGVSSNPDDCSCVGSRLPNVAKADEGGLSFWLPGQQGSFAATPGEPGWSWTTVYLHTSVEAGADQAFPRGGKGRVSLGLEGRGDLVLFGPTYTFTTPLLGGQFSLSRLSWGGRSEGSVDVTLTGPRGNTFSGNRTESFSGFGDVIPQATLKWNHGVARF